MSQEQTGTDQLDGKENYAPGNVRMLKSAYEELDPYFLGSGFFLEPAKLFSRAPCVLREACSVLLVIEVAPTPAKRSSRTYRQNVLHVCLTPIICEIFRWVLILVGNKRMRDRNDQVAICYVTAFALGKTTEDIT